MDGTKNQDINLEDDPELRQIMDEIRAGAELAASSSNPVSGQAYKIDGLKRVASLMRAVADALDALARLKCSTAEARYITDFLRGTVYRWEWEKEADKE